MEINPKILDEHVERKQGTGIQPQGAILAVLQVLIPAHPGGQTEQVMLRQRITPGHLHKRHQDEILLRAGLGNVHVVVVIHFQRGDDQQPEIARLVGIELGADLLALRLRRRIARQ